MLENEVLIEITLSECKIWSIDNKKDINNQETITLVNFKEQSISEIICDKM